MVDYSIFWETLNKKGYTQYILVERFDVSRRTINCLLHNKNMNINTLNNLCAILDCDFSDIVRFVPGPNDIDYSKAKEITNEKLEKKRARKKASLQTK